MAAIAGLPFEYKKRRPDAPRLVRVKDIQESDALPPPAPASITPQEADEIRATQPYTDLNGRRPRLVNPAPVANAPAPSQPIFQNVLDPAGSTTVKNGSAADAVTNTPAPNIPAAPPPTFIQKILAARSAEPLETSSTMNEGTLPQRPTQPLAAPELGTPDTAAQRRPRVVNPEPVGYDKDGHPFPSMHAPDGTEKDKAVLSATQNYQPQKSKGFKDRVLIPAIESFLGGGSAGGLAGGIGGAAANLGLNELDRKRKDRAWKNQALSEANARLAQDEKSAAETRDAAKDTADINLTQARTDALRNGKPLYKKIGGRLVKIDPTTNTATPVTDQNGKALADHEKPAYIEYMDDNGVDMHKARYNYDTDSYDDVEVNGKPIVSKRVEKIDPKTGLPASAQLASDDRHLALSEAARRQQVQIEEAEKAQGRTFTHEEKMEVIKTANERAKEDRASFATWQAERDRLQKEVDDNTASAEALSTGIMTPKKTDRQATFKGKAESARKRLEALDKRKPVGGTSTGLYHGQVFKRNDMAKIAEKLTREGGVQYTPESAEEYLSLEGAEIQ